MTTDHRGNSVGDNHVPMPLTKRPNFYRKSAFGKNTAKELMGIRQSDGSLYSSGRGEVSGVDTHGNYSNAWSEPVSFRNGKPSAGSGFGSYDSPVCEDCGTSIDHEEGAKMFQQNRAVTCPECSDMRDFGRSESADARNSSYYDYREE